MTDPAMSYLSKVLDPIKVVVWGEMAMGVLGVPTVVSVSIFTLFRSADPLKK